MIMEDSSAVDYVPEPCCICDKEFPSDVTLACHLIDHSKDKWYRTAIMEERRKELAQKIASLPTTEDDSDDEIRIISPPQRPKLISQTRRTKSLPAVKRVLDERAESPAVFAVFSDSSEDDNIAQVTDKLIGCRLKKPAGKRRRSAPTKSNLQHKCRICGVEFTSRGSLQEHMSMHRKPKEHLCYLCKKSFDSRLLLRDHLNQHIGTNRIQCVVCGRNFSTKAQLRKHEKSHFAEVLEPRPKSSRIARKPALNFEE